MIAAIFNQSSQFKSKAKSLDVIDANFQFWDPTCQRNKKCGVGSLSCRPFVNIVILCERYYAW